MSRTHPFPSLPNAAFLLSCLAAPALAAAGWVADARKAPFPAAPAAGKMLGQPFQVRSATVRKSGGIKLGGASVDQYALELRSETSSFGPAAFEGQVVVAVKTGQKPYGRTFRQVAVSPKASLGDRLNAQPAAAEGIPEIQGIRLTGTVKGEHGILYDDVETGITCRVEFGKAADEKVSGKIYLAARDPRKSYVAGQFTAVVR